VITDQLTIIINDQYQISSECFATWRLSEAAGQVRQAQFYTAISNATNTSNCFIHLPSEVLTLRPLTYNVIKHFKTKGINLTGYLLHCITVTVTKYTCSVLLTISIKK